MEHFPETYLAVSKCRGDKMFFAETDLGRSRTQLIDEAIAFRAWQNAVKVYRFLDGSFTDVTADVLGEIYVRVEMEKSSHELEGEDQ